MFRVAATDGDLCFSVALTVPGVSPLFLSLCSLPTSLSLHQRSVHDRSRGPVRWPAWTLPRPPQTGPITSMPSYFIFFFFLLNWVCQIKLQPSHFTSLLDVDANYVHLWNYISSVFALFSHPKHQHPSYLRLIYLRFRLVGGVFAKNHFSYLRHKWSFVFLPYPVI